MPTLNSTQGSERACFLNAWLRDARSSRQLAAGEHASTPRVAQYPQVRGQRPFLSDRLRRDDALDTGQQDRVGALRASWPS